MDIPPGEAYSFAFKIIPRATRSSSSTSSESFRGLNLSVVNVMWSSKIVSGNIQRAISAISATSRSVEWLGLPIDDAEFELVFSDVSIEEDDSSSSRVDFSITNLMNTKKSIIVTSTNTVEERKASGLIFHGNSQILRYNKNVIVMIVFLIFISGILILIHFHRPLSPGETSTCSLHILPLRRGIVDLRSVSITEIVSGSVVYKLNGRDSIPVKVEM